MTAIDLLPRRVELLQDLSRGGITNLTARQADLCSQPFPDNAFDTVTLLEVLEIFRMWTERCGRRSGWPEGMWW